MAVCDFAKGTMDIYKKAYDKADAKTKKARYCDYIQTAIEYANCLIGSRLSKAIAERNFVDEEELRSLQRRGEAMVRSVQDECIRFEGPNEKIVNDLADLVGKLEDAAAKSKSVGRVLEAANQVLDAAEKFRA